MLTPLPLKHLPPIVAHSLADAAKNAWLNGMFSLKPSPPPPPRLKPKSNLVYLPGQMKWKEIGRAVGCSAVYARYVHLGIRRNPEIKSAIEELAAAGKLPPTRTRA